jgi:hypothetical protein
MMGGGCVGGEEAEVKEDKAHVVLGLKELVDFFYFNNGRHLFDFFIMKYYEFLNFTLTKNLQINAILKKLFQNFSIF